MNFSENFSNHTTEEPSTSTNGLHNGNTEVATLLPLILRLLLSSLSILLNTIVFGILLQERFHQQDHSYKFLVSLILASGLGGLGILLFSLWDFIPHNFWGCLIIYNDMEVLELIMWLTLLFVNLDQLIKIEYPLRYPVLVTNRVVHVCLIISWTLPPILQLSAFFADAYNYQFCKHNVTASVPSVGYSLYLILVQYVIPVLVVGIVQCRILYNVRKQRRIFHAIHGRPSTSKLEQVNKVWPSIITASIIFGTVFVTSTPVNVMLIGSTFGQNMIGDYGVFSIFMSLRFSNFLFNPVIYAVRFKEVKRLLFCQVCCSKSKKTMVNKT